MSQRAKVLLVIALAVFPLVALSGFTIWQQYLRDEALISNERTYFAQATALAAEHFLDGQVAAARGPSEAADKPLIAPAKIVDGNPAVLLTLPGGRVVPVPTERFAQGLMQKISSPLLDLTVIDSERQAFIRGDQVVKELVKLEGPHVDAVLGGRTGTAVARFGERSSLIAYAPVGNYGWGVLLTEPTVSAFASARRQVLERGAVVAVILAVIGALGWTLAGRLAAAYQTALQARAEAERLASDLKRALHARDEFLATASHDLRNPLSTIQSAAELLERSLDEPQARDRLASCADHIQSAAKRMAQQLDAFLDVSRLEAGRPLELKKRQYDLMPLVRQVLADCQQTTQRHRLLLEGPALLAASVDAARLQRVVGNLIGNAIKYSPDGGEVNVKVEAHDTDVIITVRDRGIGIPGSDQARVFERFQRGTNVEGRFAGTGIGLAGAKQIVEQHGGAITVKSQVGKGSTFTVRFPAGTEAAKAHAA
jgi:signal transduction histidine kinase